MPESDFIDGEEHNQRLRDAYQEQHGDVGHIPLQAQNIMESDEADQDCCEEIRAEMIKDMKRSLEMTAGNIEHRKAGLTAEQHARLMNPPGLEAVQNMSCEELMASGYATQGWSFTHNMTYADAYNQCAGNKMPMGGDFTTGEPMDIAWRLLKASMPGVAGYPEDDPDWEDPLDREQKCPQCNGQGQFAEGPFDGEGGTDYDYITCATCKGSGTIEHTHHPGEQSHGLRHDRTIFDVRDPGIRGRFDVDNAMVAGNAVMTDDGILQPKRLGYPICETCAGEGRAADAQHGGWDTCPSCEGTGLPPAGMAQTRMTDNDDFGEPEVYASTIVESPEEAPRATNANIRFGSDPQGIFTTGEPMDIAMRLLKEGR